MAALNRHTLATQYPLSNITVKWESIGFPTNAQVGLAFRAVARRPVPCLQDRPLTRPLTPALCRRRPCVICLPERILGSFQGRTQHR